MHIACKIPAGIRPGLAAQHADGDPQSRQFLALDLDRVDARDQADGLVRDQVAVQQPADVGCRAAGGVPVIVGYEVAQIRRIALLGREFGRIDQRADLVLRRAGRAAARECEQCGQQQAIWTEDRPSIAAVRR